MSHKRILGFWILIIPAVLILVMLLVGQMMSLINYEFTVSIGMQESVDVIGEMGVAVNKGFGVGDTIIYLPFLIIGLAGLWLTKKWGMLPMAGALGVTAYWPIVNLFILIYAEGTPGFNFTDYISYIIVLSAISIYGLWGFWYLFKYQKLLFK